MNDDAEKIALGDALQRFRETSDGLDLLSIEMKKAGEQLAALADLLRNPAEFSACLDPDRITVGSPNAQLGRPIAEIRERYLNWDNLRRLINDYQNKSAMRKELAAKLHLNS